MTESEMKALELVLTERVKQEKKWGEQNHNPFIYLAILGEEYGELAKECVEHGLTGLDHDNNDRLLAEAVDTAAVALAFVACLLRAKWRY